MTSVLSIILATQTATADCSQVIKECNAALDKADAVIHAQNDVIIKYTSALDSCREQNKQLEINFREAEEGRTAWYRQPEVTITAGAVIGALLAIYLSK